MRVTTLDHPLIHQRLGQLRAQPQSPIFRKNVRDLCRCLTYEAMRSFPLIEDCVEGWQGSVQVHNFVEIPTAVPILRAGLGMLQGFLDIFPEAPVSMVGLFRNEETLEPVGYYHNFVDDIDTRIAFVLDPMLATGGSANASIKLLKEAGCKNIYGLFLIASPQGIANVQEQHPDINVYTCAIDAELNAQGYILPGIGDAGDLIFGT